MLESLFIWIPKIVPGLLMALTVFLYFYLHPVKQDEAYWRLIFAAAGYRIIFAALLTAAQYYSWVSGAFSQLFLDSRVGGIGYFTQYTWTHFWLNVVMTLVSAYLFWVFLKSLRRYKDRFFEKGELLLGFLVALIVGWPNFVLFLPITFVLVVIFSLVRGYAYREPFTTLGLPFLIAGIIVLFFGGYLIHLLGLTALRI